MPPSQYAKIVAAPIPQTEPLPGQTQNDAGGYSWAIDQWTQLDRFLVLGSDTPTYYTDSRKLTLSNVASLDACLQADPARTVNRIAEVSVKNIAPRPKTTIFALAYAAAQGNPARALALGKLPQVCRTASHLFQWIADYETLRQEGPKPGIVTGALVGRWGRSVRRAVGSWMDGFSPDGLAYQAVKYRQRNGWSLRDVLRVTHKPLVPSEAFNHVVRWSVGKHPVDTPFPARVIEGYEAVQKAQSPKDAMRLVRDYRLPWEAVPSNLLADSGVWDALLHAPMPLTALIRNLGRMTANGLLTPLSDATREVIFRLEDTANLLKSRIHPIAVLTALMTYKMDHGIRGQLTWTHVPRIMDALDDAFYSTFPNAPATNQRWLLGVDISGSMGSGTVAGVPGLTPRMAAAAMALVIAAREPRHVFMGFSTQAIPLAISPGMRLDQVMEYMAGIPMGGTDCALPIIWAAQQKYEIDAFVTLTDSETYAGRVGHPAVVLREYRKRTGIQSRNAVIAMTSEGFTIADPKDPGMLDFVGFDASVPPILARFMNPEVAVGLQDGDEE